MENLLGLWEVVSRLLSTEKYSRLEEVMVAVDGDGVRESAAFTGFLAADMDAALCCGP